jgi:hypothetical protein
MVLNPALYAALKQRFGTVKVSNPGAKPSYMTIRDERGRFKVKFNKGGGGEQYNVCCPFCGDRRYRLEIGHTWLTIFPRTAECVTHNLKCYNEQCEGVYKEDFYRPFISFINGDGQLHAIMAAAKPDVERPKVQMRMPAGCTPLTDLPAGHRALSFIRAKYNNLDPAYLSLFYGACFTEIKDELYRLAHERIIFPVYDKGVLVGWQGRAVDPANQKRWYLPPGFQKVLYHADAVGPLQVPIIGEGITSSICCGPTGIAIFGKDLDETKCKDVAARWMTAVIALDPTCSLPDPHANGRIFAQEMKAKLDQFLRVPSYILQWPREAMVAAAKKFDYELRKIEAKKAKLPAPPEEKHAVPDAADYGIPAMAELLKQIPPTHRGAV